MNFNWNTKKHKYTQKRNFIYLISTMKKLTMMLFLSLLSYPTTCLWAEYSYEIQQAYNWAYEHQITTMDSIWRANMNWNLTRAELAKMISNYMTEVLWKEIDTTKKCNFNDVSEELNPDLVESVTKSCQLWLMGQWINSFKPKDSVTRAEFWTILSRALRWNKNEWWTTYYQNHLNALKTEWIMTNISYPMNKELRWYVMLMLMRSTNNDSNNYTIEKKQSDTDNQISDVIKLLD